MDAAGLRGLSLDRLLAAQTVEPVALLHSPASRVAVDSQGNLLLLQFFVRPSFNLPGVGPGGIGAPTIGVQRYRPNGELIASYLFQNPLISPDSSISAFAVDSGDAVYVAGNLPGLGAAFVRRQASDWRSELDGLRIELRALAFDPQNNLVVLAHESRHPDGAIRILKLHRDSGRILIDRRFGTPDDQPAAIAVDATGVYITGSTSSARFPTTPGAFQERCSTEDSGCGSAFVVKFDADLASIRYATLLRGVLPTFGRAIAVGGDGSAYVAGNVIGVGQGAFPTTLGAFQPDLPSARCSFPYDSAAAALVARLDSSGSQLLASTFLAGSCSESATDLRLDATGHPVVLGVTLSHDFPRTGPSSTPCGPDRPFSSLFATKLDPLLQEVESSVVLPQMSAAGLSPLGLDGSAYLALTSTTTTPSIYAPSTTLKRLVRVNLDWSQPDGISCVVNGANYRVESFAAAGQLLTLFGQGLGPEELVAFGSRERLPVEAAGTEVRIGGELAPLLAVSSTQINAVVPYGLRLDSRVKLEVRREARLIYSQPMINVHDNPTPLPRLPLEIYEGWPLAELLNEEGTANSATNPALAGSVVTLFATGYGALRGAAPDGLGTDPPARPEYPKYVAMHWGPVIEALDVSTVAGRTNAVLKVRFRVPAKPPWELIAFRLGGSGFTIWTNFSYVRLPD